MAETAGDLVLRDATLDDAAFVADVWTAARPSEPQDPVMTAYWWEHPWDGGTWSRHVATLEGAPVGFGAHGHVAWDRMPERWSRMQLELLPAARTASRLASLLAFLEEGSRAGGALRASVWAWADDAVKLEAAVSRGFAEARRERFWGLDLVAHRDRLERMAAASRAKMRDAGIEIATLDRVADPGKYRRLWLMSEEAEQDIPTTVPHVGAPFEAFMEAMRAPNTIEDRVWVARRGDDVVGVSFLQFPPVRGLIETGWTGTARSVRGQGVARALKCETVLQAIALGVDRVRTDNDSQNHPILHINESMGYEVVGEMVQLLKDL